MNGPFTQSDKVRLLGVYIHAGSGTVFSGVNRKIADQIKVFSQYFDMNEVIIEKSPTNPLRSILYRLPAGSFGREYDKAIEEITGYGCPDFFYIRNQAWDRAWTGFIRTLREKWPDSKILIEIPTYPYGRELLSNPTMWPWYFKDLCNNTKARDYIDRVITYSDKDEIYGIPTIKTINGIIVDDIELASVPDDRHGPALTDTPADEMHLFAVAQFQPSHGYERIIRGLYDYYHSGGDRRIVIDLVGEGDESTRYKSLINKYNLESHVYMHGFKSGADLESIYSNADIALGCFGLYKRHNDRISSLKMSEYLAHGLPVVLAGTESVFDRYPCDYYLQFPNDPTNVNLREIIAFYDRIYTDTDKKLVRQDINRYALSAVDMSATLQPVINYICRTEADL